VNACVDLGYRPDGGALAACVLFVEWADARAAGEHVARVERVADYRPGRLFERELPGVLAVLGQLAHEPRCVVVDGYVWLAGEGRPGLGGHLFEALGRRVPVIGVAKRALPGASLAVPVLRGRSSRPLYVTAAGLDVGVAAERVRSMHGPHRIPTLLGRVDRLSRGG